MNTVMGACNLRLLALLVLGRGHFYPATHDLVRDVGGTSQPIHDGLGQVSLATPGVVVCDADRELWHGVRRNQMYTNQKHRCFDCGHYFSGNAGLGRTKLPPRSVDRVIQMVSSGTAYKDILDSLVGDGIVCVRTVCNIVRRFSKILIEYSDQLHPCTYEVWRMDDQTRLLSVQLTTRKGKYDVSRTYESGAIWACKIPHLLISDGAKSFHAAWCACYKLDNAW